MPLPTIETKIEGYEIEVIDIADLRKEPISEENRLIIEEITFVSVKGFRIDREKSDVLGYPSSDTDHPKVAHTISSESALILLKKEGQIVGYNFIVTAVVNFEGELFQINKAGPSSVLPEHRGYHFVDRSTVDFLREREKEATLQALTPFSLANTVNKKYQKAGYALLQHTNYTDDETETLNRLLQASLSGIFPKHAYEGHEHEFVQGAERLSFFEPRPEDEEPGICEEEPTATGVLFFLPLTPAILNQTEKFFAKSTEATPAMGNASSSASTIPPLVLQQMLFGAPPIPAIVSARGAVSAPPVSPARSPIASPR